MNVMKAVYFSILLFLCFSCKPKDKSEESPEVNHATPGINYVVTHVYPHDTTSYIGGNDKMGGFMSITPYHQFGDGDLPNNLANISRAAIPHLSRR